MKGPLHLDFETRSAADLKKVGAHKYAEDPTTEIILASYKFGPDGPVTGWIGETPPLEVYEHVASGGKVVGHNQGFERVIWNARIDGGNGAMKIEQQDCTMARAKAMGLPASLENLGSALDLKIQKDKAGHALMLRMCKPKTREPLTWHETQAEIERLGLYCNDDVRTEDLADQNLPALSERERRVWELDQRINDRGVKLDLARVRAAIVCVDMAQKEANREMWRITGGAVGKTTEVAKLIAWLGTRGIEVDSIADGEIDEIVLKANVLADDAAREAILLRRASAGSFKFERMLAQACRDGRVRGSLQYHGTHGGRWAGRGMQPHNMKRIDDEEEEARVEVAIDALADPHPYAALSMMDPKPLNTLTLCARPMLIAEEGHDFIDADFSNIEGRLNAWFAGEAWKLQAFRDHDDDRGPDMYKATAARILGKHPDQITKPERQHQGKVPELACGYQGGVRAFLKMGAKQGVYIPTGQAAMIVADWRAANPSIVAMWRELQEAAISAVQAPGCVVSILADKVRYLKPPGQDFLFCRLPSGRVISYAKPVAGWTKKILTIDDEEVELNSLALTYWGEKNGRFMKLDLYGGAMAAHVVSGTARDVLVEAAFAVEEAGYPLVLTVHDELLSEVLKGFGSIEEYIAIIRQRITGLPWLQGLPFAVKAWRDERYVK